LPSLPRWAEENMGIINRSGNIHFARFIFIVKSFIVQDEQNYKKVGFNLPKLI